MKHHPVSFNPGRLATSSALVDAHLAEARRLRGDELARLCGLLWRAPAAALRRAGANRVGSGATGAARRA